MIARNLPPDREYHRGMSPLSSKLYDFNLGSLLRVFSSGQWYRPASHTACICRGVPFQLVKAHRRVHQAFGLLTEHVGASGQQQTAIMKRMSDFIRYLRLSSAYRLVNPRPVTEKPSLTPSTRLSSTDRALTPRGICRNAFFDFSS